jgi:ribosomal protein S18 acetylase RimI-like enzyme
MFNKNRLMIEEYRYREVKPDDLAFICKFPQDENELYFMYPKAEYPLDVHQLQSSIKSRFDSTVILSENVIVGFANFYEVIMDQCCSIGNVIVNPLFRGKGVGIFLINTMESMAIKKYNVKEVHISCFNPNVTGLLLYNKLGYSPYEIEKRFDKNSLPIALIKMKKEINSGHLLNT